jgi:hypothetical protein
LCVGDLNHRHVHHFRVANSHDGVAGSRTVHLKHNDCEKLSVSRPASMWQSLCLNIRETPPDS